MSTSSDKKDELEGTEAPFVSHLVELRDRLVRALIAVVLACTTCSPRRWWRTCPRARR
jgi:Sec-independent protein secretion pathway component TatC